MIKYNGEVHSGEEWARIVGICKTTIYGRLKLGWSVGQALGYEERNHPYEKFGEVHNIANSAKITGIDFENFDDIVNKWTTGKKFDYYQKFQIYLGVKSGVDVSKYADCGYTGDQMEEIRIGLEKGLDITIYSDYNFNDQQMREIRFGIESGVDVSKYVICGYTWQQMREIRIGLEKGLDITIYSDPGFNDWQMKVIREGIESGVDVNIYAKRCFDFKQMHNILWGLKTGINVSIYADPKYTWEQMRVILFGLMKGFDVSIYANSGFNVDKMEKIYEILDLKRFGCLNEISVEKYCLEDRFNAEQLRMIYRGLKEGVDVDIYADPKFSVNQMEMFLNRLIELK